MSEQFKPGDRVVCVNTFGTDPEDGLARGARYTVKEAEAGFVVLEGVHGDWYPHRFRLVEAPVEVGTFPFLNPGPGRV